MNKIIKFRGKRVDTGEWVYGSLIENQGRYFIYHATSETTLEDNFDNSIVVRAVEVKTDTICQFVDYTDGDDTSREAYVGDVIQWTGIFDDEILEGILAWDEDEMAILIYLPAQEELVSLDENVSILRVTGNIIDNPKLLR